MTLRFRLWRLSWRIRLRWRGRQLTKMQRRTAAILLANHANLARLEAQSAALARTAKKLNERADA